MKPDTCFFFAAGLGTRMGALTKDRPKPLIEVGGTPLVDHIMDLAVDAGVTQLAANLHYKADMLRDHLAERTIAFSDEFPDRLETGGGLKKALPLLGPDPIFTANTDAIWAGTNPFEDLGAAYDPDRMDCLLLLVDPENAIGHQGAGDFVTEADGRIVRGAGRIYGGLQILHPKWVAAHPGTFFSLNEVWDELIARGRAYGITYNGKWADVGRPENIGPAAEILAARHG